MLIERIKLKNLLSFGPEGIDLELHKLNVLIGPNGSGKSNLIEAINLLRSVPRDLTLPIRLGGGIGDWIWRGSKSAAATIECLISTGDGDVDIRHRLSFGEVEHDFRLLEERIEDAEALPGRGVPQDYYRGVRGRPRIRASGKTRFLPKVDQTQSILSQYRDPVQFPELTRLGEFYGEIRIYREWSFGRHNPLRDSPKTDLRNDHLDSRGANLALVLSRLKRNPVLKRRIVEMIGELSQGFTDFDVQIDGGRARLFLEVDTFSVPANWLSDGTLKYLTLLAILLDPQPSALVCIDEPELEMHPDLIVTIGKLLVDASERMQLIVTTHSPVLLDALQDRGDDVVVCERHEGGTAMRRLPKTEMDKWLKDYSLSELWSSGQIGGNRW